MDFYRPLQPVIFFFYLERKSDKGLIFELLCRGVQENKPNSTRETTTKTAYK
jgi:hypothetical protein